MDAPFLSTHKMENFVIRLDEVTSRKHKHARTHARVHAFTQTHTQTRPLKRTYVMSDKGDRRRILSALFPWCLEERFWEVAPVEVAPLSVV